jgi:Leucine-rich repeat (LRR) protein
MISQEQDQIIKNSFKKRYSFNVTPPSSSQQSRKRMTQKQKHETVIKIDNNNNNNSNDDLKDIDSYIIPLQSDFYFNITTDGLKHMDHLCHLTDDQVEYRTLERQLRPISGLRNRLKRNAHKYDETLIEKTDLVKRISKIHTIKRLDMSYNDLNYYPKPLCELLGLETLNLSNNKLQDQDLPLDFDKYQNLIEIILDSNQFKTIPKSLIKFKKLLRLSIRDNLINEFKNIENLRKLRYLVADNNSITRLDDTFINIDKLELLHLKFNSINSIQTSILKSNFNHLKQLDLSYNKLQSIPCELLMLPRIEILSLSNNLLTRLPILPVTFKRAIQMYIIDVSSNFLTKFYEYLLSLATYIDISSNKLQSLPSKAIKSLNIDNLKSKTLKLDNNPLDYPPIDVCISGLKVIKQFFEEASAHIQLNHGFKLMLIGDSGSGK